MKVKAKFKLLFFDREIVVRSVESAKIKVLSKIGAFVRTRARSLIRKRKAVAPPRKPPSSHVGTLRALIYFGFDPITRSVVVGPVIFGTGTAPNLLEFSGWGTIRDKQGRSHRAHYRGNPFMGPALSAEIELIPEHWRNSVKK